MSNLEKALAPYFEITNKKSNNKGVLELYLYLFKPDIFYFNWIENIPSRRFGRLQVAAFLVFLYMARLSGRKIVWTLHNKYSHDKENSRWTDYMYGIMFRYSDYILTHSREGIEFARERYPAFQYKVKYYIHPVNQLFPSGNADEIKYDFLIWGTIWPYKGITEFLKYIEESGNTHFRVLIAGICINDKMKAELDRYLNQNVIHLNKFLDISEIAELARHSKFILFTYNHKSVLSSGSLMDSIAMRSLIIGPDIGAFKDLSSENFVRTYNSYSDIIEIHRNYSHLVANARLDIDKFWCENKWETFGKKLFTELN